MPSLGGWELNTINTAHTGTPLNVDLHAVDGQRRHRLSNDYRGQPFLRPNVSGSAIQPEHVADDQHLFRRATPSPRRRPARPSAIWAATPSARRASSSGTWRSNKNFRITEGVRLQFRSEFFNILNHTNFGFRIRRSTSAAFGTIRTTYPARQIQFALKLMF